MLLRHCPSPMPGNREVFCFFFRWGRIILEMNSRIGKQLRLVDKAGFSGRIRNRGMVTDGAFPLSGPGTGTGVFWRWGRIFRRPGQTVDPGVEAGPGRGGRGLRAIQPAHNRPLRACFVRKIRGKDEKSGFPHSLRPFFRPVFEITGQLTGAAEPRRPFSVIESQIPAGRFGPDPML